MEDCKEMSGEDGAKLSVLKELLGRMYKLMAMDKPKEAESMGMEEEESEGEGPLTEVAEETVEGMDGEPKKKLPKYAMLGMSLKTKEAPKPMMGKGKRYG